MDILDILLDILLKPPQPFIGLFFNKHMLFLEKGMKGENGLNRLITGCNKVVAKVMFLHVSVILLTGGVSRQGEPPRDRETPLDQAEPPGPGRTPRDRETPPGPRENPPDQADPPRPRENPPRPGRPPHRKQTPEYCLRAAGTHPTGMHSCLNY